MSGSPFIKGDYQIKECGGGWWSCVCECEARDVCRAAPAVHGHLARAARNARGLALTVSDEWQMLWSGPTTMDSYVKEFGIRARAALARLDTKQPAADYMPTEVDLRSFLRPSRVIWALRAHTAARLNCNIHALTLSVKWNWNEGESTQSGIVVRGVRLSGAQWAGSALAPCTAAAPPHAPAPPLLLRYVLQESDNELVWERSVEVPVYNNEARESIVFSARAPLVQHFEPDLATLHAIALFIAAND
ncbi:cytoplasmic dynein 2 heavy chain 1-like [Spodoptera frugiperda]|uniref:Cytoplasmic dynein 2 heavy chain 1-like n=1 Tax=Spodoptera frugiperda TaxID=7108 RepID=A0A9R0E8H3_SPOFR|nr:cytoplasmic dynein 2 heavy chain 1-like [Spodoptera frugiperda]